MLKTYAQCQELNIVVIREGITIFNLVVIRSAGRDEYFSVFLKKNDPGGNQ